MFDFLGKTYKTKESWRIILHRYSDVPPIPPCQDNLEVGHKTALPPILDTPKEINNATMLLSSCLHNYLITWLERNSMGGDILLNYLEKAVGNGDSISVLYDSWIIHETNLRPIGLVHLKDQDLMVSALLSRETKEWNSTSLDGLFLELTNHILKIRPRLLDKQNSLIWTSEDV